MIYKTPQGKFMQVKDVTDRERRIFEFLECVEFDTVEQFIHDADFVSNKEFLNKYQTNEH